MISPSKEISNSLTDLEFVTKCIVWDIEELVSIHEEDGSYIKRSKKHFGTMCDSIELYLKCFPVSTLKELRNTKYKDYVIDW